MYAALAVVVLWLATRTQWSLKGERLCWGTVAWCGDWLLRMSRTVVAVAEKDSEDQWQKK